jgi:hypothetical protein
MAVSSRLIGEAEQAGDTGDRDPGRRVARIASQLDRCCGAGCEACSRSDPPSKATTEPGEEFLYELKATTEPGEEFLYELKAGPEGGRLRRPSSAADPRTADARIAEPPGCTT